MIKYNINTSKIDKALLYKGEKGVYLSGVFFENKDGTDQYGNDGFIVQDVSKEQRTQGMKGPIIGNWKRLQSKSAPAQRTAPVSPVEDDDIPF